jgi:small basic protein
MFLIPIFALALGFAFVYLFAGPMLPANEALARYTALAVLAGLDTVLGGIRAWLTDTFEDAIFISGFFLNALLAVGFVLLGEQLGLETGLGENRISVMMIGAVVVFSGRILNNLAALRRIAIENLRGKSASTPSETATVK